MNRTRRRLHLGLATAAVVALASGCASARARTETTVTGPTPSTANSAEATWDAANALAESTQAIIPGDWVASDSAAEPCGTTGVRWGINRFGPSTTRSGRADVVAAVDELWARHGHPAVRSPITGDAPGVQLRSPAVGVLADGFFVEFGTTDHGSTLQLQTPCVRGDHQALNAERYAERHISTPPDVPGG